MKYSKEVNQKAFRKLYREYFVDRLRPYFIGWFGDLWWGSLTNESNPNKSETIENVIFKKRVKKDSFIFFKCVYWALKKYAAICYIKLISGKKEINKSGKYVIIDYIGDHLGFLRKQHDENRIRILMPQKTDYKICIKRSKLIKQEYIIHDFISLWNIIGIFFRMFYWTII